MHGEEKDVLRQVQEFYCLREFVVSSDPRSAPKTTKSHFSWRFTCQVKPAVKVTFVTWKMEEAAQLDTELILVDTNWHYLTWQTSKLVYFTTIFLDYNRIARLKVHLKVVLNLIDLKLEHIMGQFMASTRRLRSSELVFLLPNCAGSCVIWRDIVRSPLINQW